MGARTAPERSPLRVQKRAPRPSEDHKRAVVKENLASAALSASDARWAFAVRVAASIEGGRAGILRPAVRQKLVQQATQLGLRPFDANLVIAIVQDSSRTFGSPLSDHAADRLRLVRDPREASLQSQRWSPLAVSLAVSLIAVALAWTVINWLRG